MHNNQCFHGRDLDEECPECQIEFENSRIGQERPWIKPEEEAA